MIQAVKLENFQSHKKSVLKLGNGLNIIVGENDAGKTAIIRALRWVLFNDLKGDYFRSRWGGDTIVKIKVDDHVITRVRTKKENFYMLDKQKLFGFGNKVPPEIQQILNMDELNFQSQFDNVFLFSFSGAESTKILNKVLRLDLVDKVATAFNVRKRGLQSDLKFTEMELEKRQDELQKLSWLPKAKKLVDRFNRLKVKYDALEKKINDAEMVIEKLHELESVPVIDTKKANKLIKDAEKLQAERDKLRGDILKVESVLSRLETIKGGIKEAKQLLKKKQKELKGLQGETCPFCGRVIDENLINE